MLLRLLVLFLFLCPAARAADAPGFSFTGHIQAGQVFRQALPGGLLFKLVPDDKGWLITITDGDEQADHPYQNLADVTLPLHGINATQLEGWHFRNADNTGANDGSVNAPQEERDVSFTTRQHDFDVIMAYYSCVTGPDTGGCTEPAPLPWGTARLTVTRYELDPPQQGEQAAFKSLDFSVTGHIAVTNRILP